MELTEILKRLTELRNEAMDEFSIAMIAMEMREEHGLSLPDDKLLSLAERIRNIPMCYDEPRFDAWDFADAVCNTSYPIDYEKLAELSDDDFAEVLIFLAEKKRETYSEGVAPSQYGEELVSKIST